MHQQLAEAKSHIEHEEYETALEVLQGITGSADASLEERAEAWVAMSSVFRATFDVPGSSNALDKAVQLYKELGNTSRACQINLMVAKNKLNTQHYREAGHRCNQVMHEAEENDWQDLIAMACDLRGMICFHIKQVRESIEYYQKAEKLYQETDQQVKIDQMALRVATSYFALGQPEEAKPYYEKGSRYHEQNDDVFAMALHRSQVIMVAWMNRDLDSARSMLVELEEDIKGRSNEFTDSFIQQAYGMMYLACGEYRDAKKHFLKCLVLLEQGSNFRFRVAILTALAIVSIHLDDPQEALSYIQSSRDNCLEQEDIETLLVEYYIAIVYLANDNHELAKGHWDTKAPIEWTTEMELEYEWMAAMLEHILAPEYRETVEVSFGTSELAGRCLEEVRELNRLGRQKADAMLMVDAKASR